MRTLTRPTGRLLSRTTQLPARIGILVMLALGLVFVVAPHASAQTARDTVVAVSYTHLDVYKRQLFGHPSA